MQKQSNWRTTTRGLGHQGSCLVSLLFLSLHLLDRDHSCCSWDLLKPLLLLACGSLMTKTIIDVFTLHMLSICSRYSVIFSCCCWGLPNLLLQISCPLCPPTRYPAGLPSLACQSISGSPAES